MRLKGLAALLFAPIAYASQIPLTTYSTTLVDLLSADPDYTQLLRVLQRTRLIPTLNKLNGSTLFAPTNDAIRRYRLWDEYLNFPEEAIKDNINEQIRQTLLYHLLNYTLPSFPPAADVETYNTLHFPRIPIEPPSKDPAPAPPWLPVPGGSLNNESQRLRAVLRDGRPYVGVDALGQDGVLAAKEPVSGTNCLLVGIDDVMDTPTSLAAIIRGTQSLSYLANILPGSQMEALEASAGLTVFLPEDSAWMNLHQVIRDYLESPFAHADLRWIVGMHVADGKLGYTDRFGDATKIRTIEGNKLHINASSETIVVSGAEMRQRDIYASNGVLHTVSDLLLPPGSLQINAEKYLLALNCTTFIELLRSVNLTSLVTDPNAEYTILAPRDDVLEITGGGSFPKKGTDELKRSLTYHFISGKWKPEKLKDGMLLETELVEVGLSGGRQVLDVGVSHKGNIQGGKRDPRKELYFAGAGVIGDAIEIDNTLIYLVSRPLTPPRDVLTVALPSLDLSTYIAAVFSTSLAVTVKNLPRTTFLIPRNSAWEKLGLVTSYLLMPSSKPELESVILHHSLNSVQYLSALRNGTERTFRTFEGTDLGVSRKTNEDGEVEVTITGSGGWESLHAKLDMQDRVNTLTETGVLHTIDSLMIPRSVQISLGKLVRAAGGGTMASLVTRAGMDWVLNGTAPPEGSEYAKLGNGIGWTLLVPRDEAWREVNLTALWDNSEAIRNLVTQHLIPTFPPSHKKDKKHKNKEPSDKFGATVTADPNSMPVDMNGASHMTARSSFSPYGQISFVDKGDYFVVGITGARGTGGEEDWAKVMTWGRSTVSAGATGDFGARGGVIKIDRVLQPYEPKWWVRYGPPIAGGLGGLIALLGVGFTARWLYKRRESEPTYEPIGRDEEEDG